MEISSVLSWFLWLGDKLKWIGILRTLAGDYRSYVLGTTLKTIHVNILHRFRTLQAALEADEEHKAAAFAAQLCTECRMAMSSLLGTGPNDLHCCFKLVSPRSVNGNSEMVSTWVRSEPFDGRAPEIGEQNGHKVSENTVWAALCGREDQHTKWNVPFSCFACNDLGSESHFACDREGWRHFYKSAMVFAIRAPEDSSAHRFRTIGFIAFDSPKPNVFRGAPNIFRFRDGHSDYRNKLEECAAFNLGSIFADTLAMVLAGSIMDHSGRAEDGLPPREAG